MPLCPVLSWGLQVYALLGAIVFSLYIIFDTYLLMNRYSYDDYIMAAVSLYLEYVECPA